MGAPPGRKSISGRFAYLPCSLLKHPAVATLDHAVFRVLLLIASRYNGRNNGALSLTEEDARGMGIGSRATLYKSFRILVERGLIVETYPASSVPPRPRQFAATWRPLDDTEYTKTATRATHDYQNWRP